MKTFVRVLTIVGLVLLAASCTSVGDKSPAPAAREPAPDPADLVVYMLVTKTPDYTDFASLSVYKGRLTGPTSYTVDRSTKKAEMLMEMDFGRYTIEGTQITIKTDKHQFVGEISDDKIVIEGQEYLKQKTK